MNYNRDGCQRQLRIKLHKLCPDGEHDIGNSKSRVEIPLTSFGKDTDSLRAVMLFLKKNRGSGNPLTNNEVHNSYNGRKVAKNACFSFPAQISKTKMIKLEQIRLITSSVKHLPIMKITGIMFLQ